MNLMTHVMVKLAFNADTATMAKMGRVWGNWMIQVLPHQQKACGQEYTHNSKPNGYTL